MKRDSKKAHAMPVPPKSVQIAKCSRCKDYRRLLSLAAGVCVDGCDPKEEKNLLVETTPPAVKEGV